LDAVVTQQPKSLAIELTVVVPTFNERENIEPLLHKLEAALEGIEWEVIWVDDDSPDRTAAKVHEMARFNRRVRGIQRIGRRGLSSAVVEGMLASCSPFLAVLDADLQHDEKLLPHMLTLLKTGQYDIVVGSRYVDGGGVGDWDERRARASRIATKLARLVVSADLTDPMSGFFMLTRPAFDGAVRRLSAQGFKILLDLFASTPIPYRFKELPYRFGLRLHGESKLDSMVAWEYLMLLIDKMTRGIVPVRFLLFALVGTTGVGVHLTVLSLSLMAMNFTMAQTVATVAAMTGNFVLNNALTYRDKRLRGWRFVKGLLSFYAVCSVGAGAGVGVASAVFANNYTWWLSGLAGAAVGVVWNYAVSAIFTWGRK
jgi:dolichol-phosphate mannosyltransferase